VKILATKIHTLLAADVSVVAIVADRIYRQRAPNSPTYPYVVFSKVVSVGQQTHDDGQGLDRTDIQFDCYAQVDTDADDLRAAVRASLMARDPDTGLGPIAGVKVQNPIERDIDETAVNKFNFQLDLTFWHNQSA